MAQNPQNVSLSEAENGRLLSALLAPEQFTPIGGEKRWWRIIESIPEGLKSAMTSELLAGNTVSYVQQGGWPQEQSVLVCMGAPFKLRYLAENPFGVVYRKLNDPHYWIEDIHVTRDGTEYLLVA